MLAHLPPPPPPPQTGRYLSQESALSPGPTGCVTHLPRPYCPYPAPSPELRLSGVRCRGAVEKVMRTKISM